MTTQIPLPKRSRERGRPRGKRRVWIDALLLTLVVLAVAGIFWPRGDRPQPARPPEQADAPSRQADASRADATLAIGGSLPSDPVRPAYSRALTEELAKIDPAGGAWQSEAVHEQVDKQLKLLALQLVNSTASDDPTWAKLLATQCVSSVLRPTNLMELYRDTALTVKRATDDLSATQSRRGRAAVVQALHEFSRPLNRADDARVKFKNFRVRIVGSQALTTALVTSYASQRSGSVQQNATWELKWLLGTTGQPPQLMSVKQTAYEEMHVRGEPGVLFVDCTEAALGEEPAYRQQLLPGLDHFSGKLHNQLGVETVGYQGFALGDVNGDRLDDLYLCQPGGLPNRLWLQQADGTFQEISQRAGVDWLDKTHSALLVDVDNDGDQDLLVTTDRELLMFANAGDARFSLRRAIRLAATPFSLCAADYDNDSDLDLYICGYGDLWSGIGDFRTRYPIPYHDANNGGPNLLLRNEGNWEFADVTVDAGLDQNNRRWSLAASWEDFDNDGDQDLYVANDFGRNNLYRNDRGRFTDIAAAAGVEDISPGMSVSWGDVNGDGRMDVYVSNMFSAAGNRITFQDGFQTAATPKLKSHYQRFARGNALFVNRGKASFHDASVAAGVTVSRWAWSSRFADINDDGRQDLLVANGFLTQEDSDDL